MMVEEIVFPTDTSWLTNEILEDIKHRQQTNQVLQPQPYKDHHRVIREAEYTHLDNERKRKTCQLMKNDGIFSHIASQLKYVDTLIEHSVVSRVKASHPQQTQRSVRSPLMRRRIKGMLNSSTKTKTRTKSKEALHEIVGDMEDTSKVIDNELIAIRQKLVVFCHATLFYRWIRGCIDIVRSEKQIIVTKIIRWYRTCIMQRHERRLQRMGKKLLRLRLFVRICRKRVAIRIARQFLQDLQSAKHWTSMQAYLRKIRLCQRVIKTFLTVNAARRHLYHLLAIKIDAELRMEAIHGRGRGGKNNDDTPIGNDIHGNRYQKTAKQREHFEYPALATERVVSRKIHNKWLRVKILVENFARYQREVLQREVNVRKEMSPWMTKRGQIGTMIGSGKESDGVLDETKVLNDGSQKDHNKDNTMKVVADNTDHHHHLSNVTTKGWKLRDNVIRKSMTQKRQKHIQNIMDAKRIAATRAAVLDIEHAKKMLLGSSSPLQPPSTTTLITKKGFVRNKPSTNVPNHVIPTIHTPLFLCLTDSSLGITWTAIFRKIIKRELRQQGD